MLKLAVVTVVHPLSVPFHAALGKSLRLQTDGNFELLVLDDRCGAPLEPLVAGLQAEIRRATPGCTLAALRRELISWAGTRAEAVLFIDADDWCAPNRVAACREHLASHDAVAHDLDIVDRNGAYMRRFVDNRVEDGKRILLNDIAESNFLGLSNTGARVTALLDAAMGIPDHVIAFDWAIYTALLAAGKDMVYDARALASYRQYENNVASVTSFGNNAIRRAVKVKVDHYALFRSLSPWYAEKADFFAALSRMLEEDAAFANAYFDEMRRVQTKNPLWWECANSNTKDPKDHT